MPGLKQLTLWNELRRFGDPSYAGFGGYPTTRDQARHHWAVAFYRYISDLVVIEPEAVEPDNSSATFEDVLEAFKMPFELWPSLTITTFAEELSNAWHAGVSAITMNPGARYSNDPDSVIQSIAPFPNATIDTLRDQLYAELILVLTNLQPTSAYQLRAISWAIHQASDRLPTTCTYGTGESSSGPLVFG